MKIVRIHFFVIVCLIVASVDMIAQTYKAVLTGRAEVPAVLTSGYGEVTAELVGDTLVVSGFFRNLNGDFAANIGGGSHIHANYAGRNGGIAHGLQATLSPSLREGVWEADSNKVILTQEQKEALNERALYVNVHTSFSPGGEIRGQLIPVADAYYMTNMVGSYENPGILTRGRGGLVLDIQEDTLTISGTFNALTTEWNGGMHLHSGFAGQNGPVSIPIVAVADTTGLNGIIRAADNRVTLSAEQKAALASRSMYANVHTMGTPSGEIRGQVTGMSAALFRAHLSGMNEVPFVPTRAGGMVIAELSEDSTLSVSGSFVGINSGVATDVAGGAHIHLGVAGRNGGIQLHLHTDFDIDTTDGTFPIDSNAFKLTEAQYMALMSRGLYVNVHSGMVRSGEIRGQLLPESQMAFSANISSVTSFPDVRSAGIGLVKGELTGNQLTLTGSFTGLSSDIDTMIAGGAHIHMASAGSTGPVIFPLNLRLDGDLTQAILGPNTFTLSDEQSATLLARGLYINVHTRRNAAGEVRGQLLPEASTYFFASLAGGNEAVPVKSGGSGQLVLEYQRNRAVTASGSFNNLEGELATNIAGGVHVHAGLNGQNGPVLVPVMTEAAPDLHSGVFDPSQNAFTISEGMADTLFSLGHYINVHSTVSPGGELRGQLLPAANAHLTAVLRPFNEVQPISDNPAHGSASAVLSGSTLRVTGSFAELVGDFAENIAGGSHIHSARAGFNGSIAVPLSTRVSGDLKSGIFRADTAYTLTPEQINGLLAGEMYVNLHSTMHASGELRGQLLSNFNAFPDATSNIVSPVPNSTIVVNSASTETLLIAWTASSDPDGDSLAYIVQVSPDPTFGLVPIQVNTASFREFNMLTLAQIDTLLDDFGIPIGFPLFVNARVIASDGSLQSIGPVSSFTLRREPPSSLPELPDGWAFDVYPTLTQHQVSVAIKAPGGSDLGLVLISSDGHQQVIDTIENSGADAFQTTIDVNRCTPGLWIVGLLQNGRIIGQQRILVVK